MSDDRKILDLQELKNEINAELQEMSEHLANIVTLDDVKVFEKIETDPVTGDLLNVEWTPEMRAKAEAKKAEAKQFLEDMAAGKGPNAEEAREAIKQAQKIAKRTRDAVNSFTQNIWTEETREHLRKVVNALDELDALRPYIEAELKKPEYNGVTLKELLKEITPAQLLELPTDSVLFKLLEAARAARSKIEAMTAERQNRRGVKELAYKSNAVMQIRGGNYPIFSKAELWDAFGPTRIFEMGSIDPSNIDDNTGEITGLLPEGAIKPLSADEISYKAFVLLNSILANSVDNVRQEFITGGHIKFYVKGVLETVTDDPRTLLDNQLNMDRKTAGVIYLENLFKPLEKYLGVTENGSRWSVFKYIGYDALTDTMEIITPYLYQLWKPTQEAYISRQQRKLEAHADGVKPKKDDFKPLEINGFFKGRAYTENETILEIAVYITNVLLTAGCKKGQKKHTKLSYKKIINNCPRLKNRLEEIEARPNSEIVIEDGKERVINNTARYNSELRKIKRAFDLILDPNKCDATQYYNFIDIQPAKITKCGRFEFIPPTKKRLDDFLYIDFERIREDDIF